MRTDARQPIDTPASSVSTDGGRPALAGGNSGHEPSRPEQQTTCTIRPRADRVGETLLFRMGRRSRRRVALALLAGTACLTPSFAPLGSGVARAQTAPAANIPNSSGAATGAAAVDPDASEPVVEINSPKQQMRIVERF